MTAEALQTMRKELAWLACQVADCLSMVMDDDEREQLQESFERDLNRELHAAFGGPPSVRAVLELVRPGALLAPVVDLAARRETVGA